MEVDGKPYLLQSFNKDLKKAMGLRPQGKKFRFAGELGLHKGKLQFVIHDPSWIK